MSDIALHIPKFRCVARLTDWVRRRYMKNRLPADNEQVFFKVAEKDPKLAAKHLCLYAHWVGPLDENLEEILRASPEHVMAYGESIARHPWNKKLPERLHSVLAGDFKLLTRLTRHLLRRLSPELELSMISGCDEKEAVSRLISYADMVGPLGEGLERRIAMDHGYLLRYFQILERNKVEIPKWMIDELKGDSISLYQLAHRHIRGRLPQYLEETMDDPSCLYEYAKNVLKGRLPEKMELLFLKNHNWAIRYAFDVVRAFSSVRLPEELHAMLILKSYENPDDQYIKNYFKEVEK